MVLDDVADWCGRYRKATKKGNRNRLLDKIPRLNDPRLAVLLAESGDDKAWPVKEYYILLERFVPKGQGVIEWWNANEADLRRRANQLPR
jgi:hypothetical protein